MKTNWQIKKLGEVCEFTRGLTYSKSDEVLFSNNAVLRANNVNYLSNALDLSEIRYIKDSFEIPENKKVKKDSLLICTASGSKEHLGKVALIDKDYNFAFGGFMGQITPKNGVESKYLYYFFISTYYKEYILKLTGGTNINNLKFSDIENIEIPLPPLSEQKRIVKILDEAFEKLEKVKENTEKNLRNSKELFESYLNDIFSNPGKDWEEKTLSEISDNLDSKRVPITKKDRESGEYPYYGASGVVDYVSGYIFDDNLLLISEDGANLLDRNYPIAFSVKGKVWVNNHAHVVKFKDIESQKFVEFYLNSIKLNDYVSGAAQPKLNQQKLNSIPIPWPTFEEQKQIVKKLDQLSEKTKKLESLYGQKLKNVEELKKSILSKAFSKGL